MRLPRERELTGLSVHASVDALALDYEFTSSYAAERLDIQGCFAAGDGSGGANSSDRHTRRCAFGVAFIRAEQHVNSFSYVGYASGSVPGEQTVPRSEATALLHTLNTTKGNCVFIADNLGTVTNYSKGVHYCPESNGLLWQAINRARLTRIKGGFGFLEVVWIKSHLSLESAVNAGFPWQWWAANWCADQLALEAAQRFALGGLQLEVIQKNADAAKKILARNVCIAVAMLLARRRRLPKCTNLDLVSRNKTR